VGVHSRNGHGPRRVRECAGLARCCPPPPPPAAPPTNRLPPCTAGAAAAGQPHVQCLPAQYLHVR
jgi:hypothetical protein